MIFNVCLWRVLTKPSSLFEGTAAAMRNAFVFKRIVQQFRKHALLHPLCRELDENIDTTPVCTVNMKLSVSLVQHTDTGKRLAWLFRGDTHLSDSISQVN